MAQIVVLDSDIISELLRGKNQEVEAHRRQYAQSFQQLTFTSATVLEVLYGYERIGAQTQLERAETLFSRHNEIEPGKEDYRLAATIAGGLSKSGRPIGLIDPLIAACAIRRGFGVATGNTAHFEFIRQLGYSFHLENWREA